MPNMTTALGDLMNLFRNQYSNLPLLVKAEDCAGKTYVVVGANIGLGYETAKHLVELGSKRVILAVRSMSRGEAALQTIESETGIHGVAAVWQLDLASYDSMIAFADRAAKELERLDALVMNAAAANKDWILCEGWESTMMVNVLGTLFLAILMMPQLEASAKKFSSKSRIVMVTSGLGYTMQQELSKIDKSNVLRDINDAKRWPLAGANRYVLFASPAVLETHARLNFQYQFMLTGATDILCPNSCKFLLFDSSHTSLLCHEPASRSILSAPVYARPGCCGIPIRAQKCNSLFCKPS